MSSQRWKRVEREIAKLLNGVRIPLLGRQGSDLDVPYLFVEVKSRKVIGEYLWTDYMAQILAAGEEIKVPAIVLHRPGMKYRDAPRIVLTRGEFETLWRAGGRVFALLPEARQGELKPGGTEMLQVLDRVLVRNH